MTAKNRKSYINGLEISGNLVYTGWQPGFEYSKNIYLKNMNTKSIKLTYNAPKSKIFTTLFPKPLTLSPGTTFTLPITFRPVEKVEYHDYVEIYQVEFSNSFRIELTAVLPQYKIDIQNELNMDLCAAYDGISKQLKLTNLSELDTYFEWDVKQPFSVMPQNGDLKPHSSINLTFTFQPKAALSYSAVAVVKYGSIDTTQLNLFKTVILTGISKYPHLLVQADEAPGSTDLVVNFEKVLYGQTMTRCFTLINMTEVKTNYFIERQRELSAFDTCFNCLQQMGTVEPFGRVKIPVSYSSNVPTNQVIYDYLNVFSSGKLTKNSITCMASNEVPKVSVDINFINFGLCNLGDKILHTFTLTNSSSSPLAYQFDSDNDFGTFKIDSLAGVIPANDKRLFKVHFEPQYPINFYKKLACLIQNHEVINIEMIGTCHSDMAKPPIVNKQHLNMFYHLKNVGLINNSPEQLMDMEKSGLLKIKEQDVVNVKRLDKSQATENYINDGFHFNDAFLDDKAGKDSANSNKIEKYITIDDPYIDFGSFQVNAADKNELEDNLRIVSQQRSITVFNRTKSKLVVCWNLSAQNQAFVVEPNTAEIPGMKSYSFLIKFMPKIPDQFYSAKLEAYALYKSLCDYTLVEPKYILPSTSITVECQGHTFHPSGETYFLPKYTVDTDSIVFPVSIKNKPVYRTLTITNTTSKYPLTFDVDKSLFDKNVCFVKPHRGVIKKSEHQIFVFKFLPTSDAFFVEKCRMMLNYMKKSVMETILVGLGEKPRVSLENEGILYFKPTCKNNCSEQTYEIANLTRTRVDYEWKIPYECKDLFSVDQIKSHLEPYEKRNCVWKFTPEKLEKFNQKVSLLTWIDEKSLNVQQYPVRILGSCITGSLQAQEMYKDLGSVIVGSSATTDIVICNNNDCSLNFELKVKQLIEGAQPIPYDKNEFCVLELQTHMGTIDARAKFVIKCRIRPTRLVNYQFTVEYKVNYTNEENEKSGQFENLCYLTVSGVYPKLTVTDVKGLGSASGLSKNYLWKILSINDLNSSMSCEPNPDELMYSIATRQEVNRRSANLKTNPMIEMNFNAAPVNSDDTEIVLFIENTGLVPNEWAILYPKDLLLELEYWAQTGEYDLEELEEMKVQDNKLFSVSPKKCQIEPGETIQVRITYKHLFSGQNKLPILMKLAKGREIMINLVGITTAKNEAYIHFPSNKFEFLPMAIGLGEYPVQIYELYNGGDSVAHVEIDSSLLDELGAQNYSRPILKCVTPKKFSVLPGTSYETKWKFQPIEAKTYLVDVSFKINNITFNVVTFKLIGYDKRKVSPLGLEDTGAPAQPENQLSLLPNQLATLSMDRISLGDVPLFSRERKVIYIRNHSSQHKITFSWHLTNPDHIQFIRIQPSRGFLDVNKSKLCKITFIAKGVPSFHNIDLICEVKNETEMEKYRRDLELWNAEQKRQFQEFIIDENELNKRLKPPSSQTPDFTDEMTNSGIEKKQTAAQSLEARFEKQRGSELSIRHFKTIPPLIKNTEIDESNVSRARKRREEKHLWNKPLPPAPFLLHFNVLAQTLFIDDYLDINKQTRHDCTKYVDPLLGKKSKKSKSPHPKPAHSARKHVKQHEGEVMHFILADLLRDLINDKTFHFMVKKTKDEEIPYFSQYIRDPVGHPPSVLSHANALKAKSPAPTPVNNKGASRLTDHEFSDITSASQQMLDNRQNSVILANSPLKNPLGRISEQELSAASELIIDSKPTSKNTDSSDKKTKTGHEHKRSKKSALAKAVDQDQRMKCLASPLFGSLIENVLENTIANILTEAFNKEFNLTSRPRLIALPPKTNNSHQNTANVINNLSRKQEPASVSTTNTTEFSSNTNTSDIINSVAISSDNAVADKLNRVITNNTNNQGATLTSSNTNLNTNLRSSMSSAKKSKLNSISPSMSTKSDFETNNNTEASPQQ